MADAMEMMILAILSPALHCDWNLPGWKQALLTTVSLRLTVNYYGAHEESLHASSLSEGLDFLDVFTLFYRYDQARDLERKYCQLLF